MPIVVYALVLLIAAGSVLFGLDWTSAPMSAMPPIKPVPVTIVAPSKPEPAVQSPVQAPLPTPAPPRSVDGPAAPVPPSAAAAPVAQAPANPASAGEPSSTPSIIAPEPGTVAATDSAPPAKCDIAACTAAYRSFTPDDCTYQPMVGPRILCTRGVSPSDPPVAPPTAATAPPAEPRSDGTAPRCNVAACAASYISFNPADCTYQPLTGPRRLCERQ